jgi:hypothetical protein
VPLSQLRIGSNVLVGVQGELHGMVLLTNATLVMHFPPGPAYPEVLWPLGPLPRGLYLLSLTARYRGESPPNDLCVLHLFDQTLPSPYPAIVIRPGDAQRSYKNYRCLLYYRGAKAPATLRLYSLARQAYEITSVGLYAIPMTDH